MEVIMHVRKCKHRVLSIHMRICSLSLCHRPDEACVNTTQLCYNGQNPNHMIISQERCRKGSIFT